MFHISRSLRLGFKQQGQNVGTISHQELGSHMAMGLVPLTSPFTLPLT